METLCPEKIMVEIEHKRREMISAAKETGFLSVQTISASQELDKLLNIIQEELHVFQKKFPGEH
ncbi:aspartyl-phosphate phosphatase Spo0E family protein [Mesobacillus boroniphilus]|nr:aspartyl-phosphate phosphatase Spo0E family protein [Mesobacillus boroniphilus]